MRVGRFTEFLLERLRESGHPGISAVDTYDISTVTHPVVRCADDSAIYLMVVRTSPPGGDDASQPETVVERDPGDVVTVRRRED